MANERAVEANQVNIGRGQYATAPVDPVPDREDRPEPGDGGDDGEPVMLEELDGPCDEDWYDEALYGRPEERSGYATW